MAMPEFATGGPISPDPAFEKRLETAFAQGQTISAEDLRKLGEGNLAALRKALKGSMLEQALGDGLCAGDGA